MALSSVHSFFCVRSLLSGDFWGASEVSIGLSGQVQSRCDLPRLNSAFQCGANDNNVSEMKLYHERHIPLLFKKNFWPSTLQVPM